MKVLSFVEGASPRFGGMGLVGVPYICLALANRGHRVVLNVAGQTTPGTEQFLRESAESVIDASGLPAFGIVCYQAFGRWRFAPSLSKLGAAVSGADFVMLHSLYSFPVLLGYMLARRHHVPYAIWPHGVLAPIQRRTGAYKKMVYDRLVARRILDSASFVFYSAKGERDEAAPLGLKAPSVIIPHGIDVAEFAELPPRGQFRSKYFHGHRGPLVLYLGRLNAKKGLDLLIQAVAEAARHVPDVRLAIAGSGDPSAFAERVHRWVSDCGMGERTVMTGLLTHDEKRAAFADADVFVLPSHAENFAFAMFEAMASRLPVVVADSLNFANEVERFGAGLVAPPTMAAFATAIETVLRDAALRQRLGANGFRLAQSYGWQRAGERMERAIGSLLSGTPLPADLG